MSRGVKHMRDVFVSHMQSQFFPRIRTNSETGEEEIDMVQGALRPVELWEYVFPEESLEDVLSMLNFQNGACPGYGLSKSKYAMLRKALKCDKIPKFPDADKKNIISLHGMGLHPIGIKKDRRDEMHDPAHGHSHEQEML